MANSDVFPPMVVGALVFSILNLYLRRTLSIPADLSYKDSRNFIGIYVSLFHSLEASILCIFSYVYSQGLDYYGDTDYLQVVTLGISLGYFSYDGVYAELYGLHDWPMRIHHICVIIGGLSLFTQPHGGAIGPVCLFLTEISNPFLEYRLILKMKKLDHTDLAKIIQNAFAFIFIFARGFLGTAINYNVHQYPLPWLLKCMVSGVYGVSLFWIGIICSMVSKDLKGKTDLNLMARILIGCSTTLKNNQIAVICAIFTWALFLPATLYALGFPTMHLVLNNFRII